MLDSYLIEYIYGFCIMIPPKHISKVMDLGISSPLFHWMLDLLTHRSQISEDCWQNFLHKNSLSWKNSFSVSPLYSLNTHKRMPTFSSYSTHIFADDTTVVGPIVNNNKTEYGKEIVKWVIWCQDNVSKANEIVIDFRWLGEITCPHQHQWYRSENSWELQIPCL